MDDEYKKRYRVPASCSVCRKRKSKCDRVKPVCGSCRKKSIAHICFYEDGQSYSGKDGLGEHILPVPTEEQYAQQKYDYYREENYDYSQSQQSQQSQPPQSQHPPQNTQPPPHTHNPIRQIPGIKGSPQGTPQNTPGQTPGLGQSTPQSLGQGTPQGGSGAGGGPNGGNAGPAPLPNGSNVPSHGDKPYPSPVPNQYQYYNQQTPPFLPPRNQYPGYMQLPLPGYPTRMERERGTFSTISSIPIPSAPSALSGSPGMSRNPTRSSSLYSGSFVANGPPSYATASPSTGIEEPSFTPTSSTSHMSDSPARAKPLPLPQYKTPSEASKSENENTDKESTEKVSVEKHPERSFLSKESVPVAVGPHTFRINVNDTISTFSNASFSLSVEGPYWQQQGTLSYAGLIKSDPFAKILRSYAMSLLQSGELAAYLRKEKLKRSTSSSTSPSTTVSSPPAKKARQEPTTMSPLSVESIVSKEKEVEDEAGECFEEDTLLIEQINVKQHDKRRKHKYQVPHMIRLSGAKEEFFRVLETTILPMLPNKLNMFMLFCRYFKYVHPFVSFVNEHTLVLDLDRILDGFPSFDRAAYKSIKLENESDVNTLGIALLVMRLGYMSLLHNEEAYNQYNDDEKNIIMDVKRISSETFIRAIKLIVDDRAIVQKSTFKLVQLLALTYFYKQMAPDDSHGLSGTDAQILFGVLMTHAKSIGLNRDPTMFAEHEHISKRESLRQVWRSLWYYLSTTDATYSLHCGTAAFWQQKECSDTALPEKESLTGEFNNVIRKVHAICDVYRELVGKMANVREKPRVVDILADTNKLEVLFTDLFGKDFFKDCIQKPVPEPRSSAGFDVNSREHEELVLKVIKYVSFINLRTNLNCMYYMVAIHYENEHGRCDTESMNAGIEIFKIFCKSVLQLVFLMSYVLDNSVETFGKNFDWVVTAHTERSMIKIHNLLTSLFVRLIHHKKALTDQAEHDSKVYSRLEIVDVLFSIVVVEADVFVGYLQMLSTNYINSYRLYVMTYFILKQCMDDPQVLFEKVNDPRYSHEGTSMVEFFSQKELQFLCKMCEDFRSAKDEQTRVRIAKLKEIKKPKASSYSLPFPDSYSKQHLNPAKQQEEVMLGESPWSGDGSPLGVFDGSEDLMRLFSMYSGIDQ